MRRVLICLVTLSWVLVAAPVAALEVRFQITGASDELKDGLKRASQLGLLASQSTPNAQDIVSAAQADYARLTAALYDQGYFGGTVNILLDRREAASIPLFDLPSTFDAAIVVIKAGPAFQFGQAVIAPLAPETALPDGFKKGETARVQAIRDAVDTSLEAWRDEGFAKAKVGTQRVTALHNTSQLNVDVALETGARLTFGELVISGNDAVRTDRIKDIAGLPEGETFDPLEVERAANRLRRTGTFRAVSLTEADQIGPGDTININAEVIEQPPRRIGFGAELSSLEGLEVSAFWLHRNLFGGAERLRFSGELGGIGGQSGGTDLLIAARFDRPATFNEDTDFYLLTEFERLDEVNFSSRQTTFETGIRRYATEKREYTLGVGVRSGTTIDALGERSFTFLTLPAGLIFDYRDDRLDATTGYFARLDLTPFIGLQDQGVGLRSYADTRAYFRLSERSVFALRGQLGSVSGADLVDIPGDFLFFSGGSGSVRGQPFQSLGAELSTGETIGGRSFLGLASEIRIKTGEQLGLVGFLDGGYIGSEGFPNGTGFWHSGAGLGVRYDTGIGPIRFDVGVPLSGPGENTGFEIYVGIGQAF